MKIQEPLLPSMPLLMIGLKIEKVEEIYECKFVGEFPVSEDANVAMAVFWQENPKEKHHTNYFGLYRCPITDKVYMTAADKAVRRTYTGILTPENNFIYSRHRHDFVTMDNCMIDGGSSYSRMSLAEGSCILNFKIVKDKLLPVAQ